MTRRLRSILVSVTLALVAGLTASLLASRLVAPAPQAFESEGWKAEKSPYIRYAMSQDLVDRMVGGRWTKTRVAAELGLKPPLEDALRLSIGMKSFFNGTWYIQIHFDDVGRVKDASVRAD